MDNSDFDKKYQKLTDEMDIALKEQEKINQQTENYRVELGLNIRSQKRLSDEMDDIEAKLGEINAIKRSGDSLSEKEQKEYEKMAKAMDKLLSQYDQLSLKHNNIVQKIGNQSIEYDKSKMKVQSIRDKIKDLEIEQDKVNSEGFKSTNVDLDNIGKKMSDTIKKVGKWTLAIFGIRSACNLITRSISIVSQYSDKMSNKIESIRYTLAMAIKPIVTKIVDWVYKLIQYVNYLAKAWFGVNLFANANEKAMNKANKTAKEMKKSLAGFDTANILSSNEQNGQQSDIGVMPELEDQEVPEWLTWLAENKDLIFEIAGYILIIAGYIQLVKFGLDGITALGIGILLGAIIKLIMDLIEYFKDPSWENFGKIIQDIGLAVLGLALIFGSLPLAIAGAIILIVGLIYENWEKIKSFVQEKIIGWLDEKIKTLRENGFIVLANILTAIRDFIKNAVLVIEQLFTGFKQVFDGIIQMIKGDFEGGLRQALIGIGNIFIALLNKIIGGINFLIQGFLSGVSSLASKVGIDIDVSNIKIPNIPTLKLYTGGIINQPGRGVPVANNTIGGEAGAEGIIPLTNEQAMEQLGEAIGRYISLTINLTTKMDNKAIAKEQLKYNQNKKFARGG